MKYRVFGIAMAVLMLLCAFAANAFEAEEGPYRYHQHLEARGPDAGCDCDGTELCTHLPLVIIDTGGREIPGEPLNDHYDAAGTSFTTTAEGADMLSAHISVMDDETRNHHPSDQADLETDTLIRIRGNSSRYFDKKSYLLRFTDEKGGYEDHEVMGMDAHYEWALYGPYLDKTLMRNYMWYNIAGEMMDYAPNVRFCEVILNGEYQGLYVMVETITNGVDCRVNVSEPVDNTTSTGYVLRLDRGSENELKNLNNFTNYTYRIGPLHHIKVNIVYPRSGALTKEMADAIEQDLSDFEKALYSFDYDSEFYGYATQVDVSSFVDYFIINEFTCNYDAGTLSTYLYKDIGGKYRFCIWDFNSACENYTDPTTQPHHFELQNNVWYTMIIRDEEFVEEIIRRYHALRESWLSDEYLIDYIDKTIAYLGPAIDRNFDVWGYTFAEYRPLDPDSRNPEDYDAAVEQMKDFIAERGEWLDEHIEVLRQYGHPSKNKKFNH